MAQTSPESKSTAAVASLPRQQISLALPGEPSLADLLVSCIAGRRIVELFTSRLKASRGTITLIYGVLITSVTFAIGGIFLTIDGHITIDDDEGRCDLAGRTRNDWTNGTDDDWIRDTSNRMNLSQCYKNNAIPTPIQFTDWMVYSITIITTIGYGHAVATSERAQVIMVIYGFNLVPLFLAFLNDAAERVRNRCAVFYERCTKKNCRGKIWDKLRTRWADLVLFTAIFSVTLLYLFIVAGVLYGLHQFDTYLDSYYFLFQTVSLIGFGDVIPNNTDSILLLVPLIVFGTLMFHLCSMVIEEWIKTGVNAMVKRKPRKKPVGEPTLANLMEDVELEIGEPVEQLSSDKDVSLYERPFNLGRVSLQRDIDFGDNNQNLRRRASKKG